MAAHPETDLSDRPYLALAEVTAAKRMIERAADRHGRVADAHGLNLQEICPIRANRSQVASSDPHLDRFATDQAWQAKALHQGLSLSTYSCTRDIAAFALPEAASIAVAREAHPLSPSSPKLALMAN